MSDGASDRALVEAARAGDRHALDSLLRSHFDRLHALCWRMTGGGPDADDAATRALLERVNASGTAFVTHTTVGGRYALRVAIGSAATTRADLDALWELLRA